MSIRSKLFASLALLGLAILLLAGSSYNAMRSMSERTRTIVEDRVIPMDQLKKIADMYAVNIVDTTHKVRAGALTWEEGDKSIRDALDVIDEQWQAYMATYLTEEEKGLAKKFEKMRARSTAQIDELLKIVDDHDQAAIETFAKTRLYPLIDPLGAPIADLLNLQIRVANEEFDGAKEDGKMLAIWLIVLSSVSVVIIGGSIWTVQSGVIKPLKKLQDAMFNLAAGDLKTAIYGEDRKDEVGQMAAAVVVFRDNGVERVRLEQVAEETRQATEEQKARDAAEIAFAVDAIAEGLGNLSDGDLASRIDTPLAAHLDSLRNDFNTAVAKLQSTLRAVGDNARVIDSGATEIFDAANDLSRRTEQQAASVEETAAALEQIATTVKDSSRRAVEAGELVNHARETADKSGEVVSKAVTAMQSIQSSSKKISTIIGVIDEIAFQTNLLALNAGVEAARAGEAGKGFAVVAMEVRELAHRSATAAKEIKELIINSTDEVHSGVALVAETGRALEAITAEVVEINKHVNAIAEGSREQALGIQEINMAINQLDQGTQHNAAMVEQSTAAGKSLANEAATLTELLAQFKLDDDKSSRRKQAKQDEETHAPVRRSAEFKPSLARTPAATRTPVDVDADGSSAHPTPSPARELTRKVANAYNGGRAESGWEEF